MNTSLAPAAITSTAPPHVRVSPTRAAFWKPMFTVPHAEATGPPPWAGQVCASVMRAAAGMLCSSGGGVALAAHGRGRGGVEVHRRVLWPGLVGVVRRLRRRGAARARRAAAVDVDDGPDDVDPAAVDVDEAAGARDGQARAGVEHDVPPGLEVDLVAGLEGVLAAHLLVAID